MRVAPDAASRARRAIDRAAAHWHAGEVDAAFVACREALAQDPANADAWSHTGTILWCRGDAVAAADCWRRAHALAPAHPGILLNLATLAETAGDFAAAHALVSRADAAAPGREDVVWRRALLALARGDYATGFRDYEVGLFRVHLRGASPGFVTPPWRGEPVARLVLWHEQGLGDTVQFVRYAALCKTRAARVVVLCPTELVALVRTVPGVDEAVTTIDAGAFDAHAPLMSLPHVFGTTVDTIPACVPYVFVDRSRARPASRDARLAVGVAWAGGLRRDQPRFHALDRRRDVPLAALAPLATVAGVDFVSLQMGPAADDARAGSPSLPLRDAMAGVRDLADTAAIVDGLDLVISVDTAVAHVAGALGKPVWILSRLDACWRWLRNRPESPWYPTARVFGQTAQGDWASVVERVRVALDTRVAAHAR